MHHPPSLHANLMFPATPALTSRIHRATSAELGGWRSIPTLPGSSRVPPAGSLVPGGSATTHRGGMEEGRLVATRAELLAAGYSRGSLSSAVRAGRLVRVRPGLFTVPQADQTSRSFVLQAALAGAGPDALLSHGTAAAMWGFVREEPTAPVHIVVPHHRYPRPVPGVVLHRTRHFEPHTASGWPVTGARQTLIALADTMQVAQWRYPALAAVNCGVVGLGELADESQVSSQSLAGWRYVAAEARAGARSGAEGAYWRLVLAAGLPAPELNVEVAVAERVYRVDALWRDHDLVAEIDGFEFHSSQSDFSSDRRRQNDLHSLGLVVMRFPAADVEHRPAEVVAMTRRMLAIRSPTGQTDRSGNGLMRHPPSP